MVFVQHVITDYEEKTFNQALGKPLFVFEMCCSHMGIACQGRGGVKTGEDGLGHFSMFAV